MIDFVPQDVRNCHDAAAAVDDADDVEEESVVLTTRNFYEDLTDEEYKCLLESMQGNGCEVLEAALHCRTLGEGWECLAKIPEIRPCAPESFQN